MPISEVYNMDCMEYMKGISDNHFFLACVDIPYGINLHKMAFLQEGNRGVKQKNGTVIKTPKVKYERKPWDETTPPQEYFDELRRISKQQIIFGADYTDWKGLGKGRIVWDKGQSEGVSFKRYETAYYSGSDRTIEIPLLWAGMCQAKSLSEPMVQQGNKKLNEKRIHPCHKPVLLYKRLFLDFHQPGAAIIDTHLGGGSSRIAAYEMKIDFTATEIDKDYFDAGNKRFELFKSQGKLF